MVTKAVFFTVFFYSNVQVVHFSFIPWYNKTEYLGHDLLWEIFEIIASLKQSSPPLMQNRNNRHQLFEEIQ